MEFSIKVQISNKISTMIAIRFLSKYFKLHCKLDIILLFIKFFSEIEKAICIPT